MAGRTRGSKATAFRARMKSVWEPVNAACGICGQATIDWDGERNEPDSFELDHERAVAFFPELEFVESNVRPAHSRCNRSKQASSGPAPAGVTSEAW